MRRSEGSLSPYLELYEELLRLQSAVEPPALASPLSEAELNSRLEQGIPLLEFDDLRLDWAIVQGLFEKALDLFATKVSPTPSEATKASLNPASLPELAREWYNNDAASEGEPSEQREALLIFALRSALYPFLVARAEQLRSRVSQEKWRRPYCPICRGSPDFAFLDRETGTRWLVCSRCDSTWLFQRLVCPFCGNADQRGLSYMTDEKGKYRLYLCEKCRSYLKAVDLRATGEDVFFPLERLLTLDLDRQALEAGYKAGG